MLLEPLRYPQSEELVALRQTAPGAAGLASFTDGLRLSPSMYFTYAEQNRTFQSLGVWVRRRRERYRAGGAGAGATVAVMSMACCRRSAFRRSWDAGSRAADQIPARSRNSVMLSYGYWQRRFGETGR